MSASLKKGTEIFFQGMLLVKQAHEDWQQKTLLMRWIEKDGGSVMFFVTGEAYAFFNAMETMRIYEGTLRPTSVQNAELLQIDTTRKSRSPEVRYAQEYVEVLRAAFPPDTDRQHTLAPLDDCVTSTRTGDCLLYTSPSPRD